MRRENLYKHLANREEHPLRCPGKQCDKKFRKTEMFIQHVNKNKHDKNNNKVNKVARKNSKAGRKTKLARVKVEKGNRLKFGRKMREKSKLRNNNRRSVRTLAK